MCQMGKQLCIVADDFGYGIKRNHGIIECFNKGAITIASLLANCKHSLSAITLAKEHGLPLGLHFNITEGCPISEPNDVPSLLNKDLTFLGKYGFWQSNSINPIHVAIELNSQIKWFKQNVGILPLRVDGHHHVHISSPVANVFAKMLSEYGIRQTRMPIEHDLSIENTEIDLTRKLFHKRVINASKIASPIFQSYDVFWMDSFIGLNFMGSAMNVEKLKLILNAILHDNTSCELMSHPGYVGNLLTDGFCGEEVSDEFSLSEDRKHELTTLTSPLMLHFYKLKDIAIVWRF